MSQNSAFGRPPDVHKRTTKVNIAVVLGVAFFLLIGGLGLIWVWNNS